MITLGIESTCDDTGIALLQGDKLLCNLVASQIEIHRPFGGVFPELASRGHAHHLLPLLDQALKTTGLLLEEIDLITVAYGPGLMGSILMGVTCAKTLALALQKPIQFVNHIEAHLFACAMQTEKPVMFPALGLVVSGGHTSLVFMEDFSSYTLLGETQDDALGEAFDKVAKLLHLPYPGGPEIEKLARLGDPSVYPFRPAVVKGKPFAFSFSGLKTKVLYTVRGEKGENKEREPSIEEKQNIAASFQSAVFLDLCQKLEKAHAIWSPKSILLGGGVTHSQTLRSLLEHASFAEKVIFPDKDLSQDNAAMIAGLGAWKHQRVKEGDALTVKPKPRIPWKKCKSITH